MSDATIIEALHGGDRVHQNAAVKVLLERIRPALIGHVQRNSGTRDDGRMIANEVVVVLWQAVQRGTYQLRADARLSTWCHTVGVNLWLKELRRRKRTADNLGPDDGIHTVDPTTPFDRSTEAEDHTSVPDAVQRAWDAFNRLGADCQRLLRMDMADTPEEEVAAELGMSNVGSVKVKRCRCKKRWVELYKAEAASR